MSELRTVTIFFDGISVDITRPADSSYEDFLYPALDSFNIPIELKDFFIALSGEKYLYGKEAFDRYVKLYPDCDFVFELRMNFLKMKEMLTEVDGRLVVKPLQSEKRKRIVLQHYFEELRSMDEFASDVPSGKRIKIYSEEINEGEQ